MKKYDLPYPKFENDNLNYYVTISDYEGKEFNIKENNLYNALSEVINYSLYFSFYIGEKHCHEHEFDYVIKNQMISKGDKIVLLGTSAGLSLGVLIFEY